LLTITDPSERAPLCLRKGPKVALVP
jgi:hypothetical protein